MAGIDGPVRCGSVVQTILVTASTSVMQMYIGMLLKIKLRHGELHGHARNWFFQGKLQSR
jgi:hypothetical protein